MMDIIKNMSSQLSSLTSKMEKIDTIESKVKNLRVQLSYLKSENTQIKADARV
jgi:hypothetical protein